MKQHGLRPVLSGFVLAAALLGIPIGAVADGVITDASGRKVTVNDTSRIVSIGGDVTEILYALKADPKIVAVDTTSQFPVDALKEKKSVGYMRALSAEGVLSMSPTVILASEGAGPPETIALLKESSIPYAEVPEVNSPQGVVDKIRFIASVIGTDAQGEALAKSVEDDFAKLAAQRSKITKPVRALFVLSVQNGRAIVGGAQTSADAMLRLAGADNAADNTHGFKPVADEAVIEIAPDAIVTMKHRENGIPSDAILRIKGLQASPAGQQNRIVVMDGVYLLSFGPRAARAAGDLMKALYPNLKQARVVSGQ